MAIVSSDGTIKSLNDGTVTITATANGLSKSCILTILKHTPVSSISLNRTKYTMEVGKTYQLKATVLPTNATYKDVTYQTSNANVAKVSSTGVITAVGKGTAVITAISSIKKQASRTRMLINIK